MTWFFYEFTPLHPYISSAIKFLILGTLGEYIGSKIKRSDIPIFKIPAKLFIWALIGVLVKWAFSSFTLLVSTQATSGLLPSSFALRGSFLFALAVSIEINLFFTPVLFYFHSLLDNLFDKKWDFKGAKKALSSILWFWIPAHTITFMLSPNFQILFAGMLSIALGIILSASDSKKQKE